ncbi:MAG: fasciclin domain-containing protein, partial [Planctomycetota bacterium]|nr:fasciclin domain-containing protein [Planctomycetota bacterium]
MTNNPSGIDGPIFTDELKDGDSLSDKFGESLNVQVAYYKTDLKAVYISVNDGSGPGACLPEAKLVDINFPVCGGTIAVHVVSQVLLPDSCDIFPTIEEVVFDTPELSLLSEAFSILDAEGITLPGRTQFAPTNLAFNRAFLLLGTNKNAVFNNIDLLSDLVKYNRVASSLPLCKLQDGDTLSTDAIGSFSPKSNFLLESAPYTLLVSVRSVLERLCGGQLANLYIFRRIVIVGNLTSAKVLVPDITACDGRVYITDQVLLPPSFFFDYSI